MIGRAIEALRQIVTELTSSTIYHALYRYRVVALNGDRLNLQAVRKDRGLPDMLSISAHPGPGMRTDPTPGSIVLVAFVEGDPALPVVVHWARPDDPAHKPSKTTMNATDTIELGENASTIKLANGVLGAARLTDTVTVGPFVGTITTASLKVKVG